MNKSLSVSEWHRLAEAGNLLPVRITLSGYSMNPFIRGFRDYVTIMPQDGLPVAGDIVMFCKPGTERYVMHRVWTVRNNMVLTWGDNCRKPDGWMPVDCIWGKVILIERGKRTIHPNPIKGLRWAAFWHHAGKIYRFVRRIRNGLIHIIRKIIS